MDTITKTGTTTGNGTSTAIAPVIEAGNLNQTFPIPTDGQFDLGGRTYVFCTHCHTPKPEPQITQGGSMNGICVNCVNGINNYDRAAAAGKVTPRPGTKLVTQEVVRLGKIVRS